MTEAQPPTQAVVQDDSLADLPYEVFIAERHKIIEARQRSEQRVDQLVTAGAAGALVLSLSFLENIAPEPDASTKPVLLGAWGLLVIALGLNMLSH